MNPTASTGLILRSAAPADAAAIVRLIEMLGYASSPAEIASRLASLVGSSAAAFVLAVARDEVLGLVMLSFRPQLRFARPIATLDELVVKDSARGMGIGRALCTEAIRVSRARGACRLSLLTDRKRESYVRGFYGKCGFLEDGAAHFVLPLE